MPKRPPAREWTAADTALWHTLAIVADVEAQRVPQRRVGTHFALADNEIALASGTFEMDSLRALGDGSYIHSSSFAFGTGLTGAALIAGTAIGTAAGNAGRRARAAADAQVVWRPDFGGVLTVTSQGFYLATQTGLFRWTWDSIRLTEVVGFTVLVLQGDSVDGPVTWRLHCDWAELVFALWALSRHPSHPQYVDGSWVPENWMPWATSVGHPPAGTPKAVPKGGP